MAAYAALLSLFHTLNQIKNHPCPPISLDQSQVESLTENLTFLQHFLEHYPSSDSREDDDLESRITAAAYAVEDVIESHVVDQIHAASTSHEVSIFPVDLLHQALEGVIRDMDMIKTEVMHKIMIMGAQDHPHLHTNSSVSTATTLQSSTMPVFDDAMINQVLDKLVGQQRSLQIIPIVGMGGIGKTTFATNIYTKPLIVQHFDTLAWITISQEYSRRNILQLLCQGVKGSIGDMSKMSEDEIGLILYQHLWGRRYFIVLDDMWSVDAWDKVKSFFRDDNNGSRVMVTTRLSNLASELSGCHVFQMQFLDEDKSWDLLCGIVFGKVDCPIELENIGKEIARKCRGLPLSIAVIGGLLKKSNMTRAYWMYTLENLKSLINLEKGEYALRVLYTSYKELPIHLKPCFLYMGIFPEDNEIKASVLIKLWIAEGTLRPIDGKSFEEVGKENLKELTDRNLILVSKLKWDGEAKLCKIHDMLRGLCLREAEKKRFFRVNVVEPVLLVRSFLHEGYYGAKEFMSSHRFRLVRVYSSVDGYNSFTTEPYNAIFEEANLRYLSLRLELWNTKWRLLSLCSRLWNLQTIKVDAFARCSEPITVSAFWEMPQIRHVMLPELVLPDPLDGEHKYVLENLQTLGCVKNFKFSEEVVNRIQNVKKLKVKYEGTAEYEEEGLPFCLNNLGRLQKLESFHLAFSLYCPNIENIRTNLANLVSFRHSLKKLSLSEMALTWEDLNMKIGSLPLLQHLTLSLGACVGPSWETVEGKFCNLRFLKISSCADLKYWDTDSTHFPRLEQLILDCIYYLEEIPSSIGEIPTLKSIILLAYCSTSAKDSAKRIKKEQQENGNEDLQVIIDGKVVQVDSDEEDQEDDQVYLYEEDQEDDQFDSDEE